MVKSYLPNINMTSASIQNKHQSKESKHLQNDIAKED
jgi:hypothetical protein